MNDFEYPAIKLKNKKLFILDQRQLPQKEVWLWVQGPGDLREYILQLCVRGAPLIAISAVCSLTLFALGGGGSAGAGANGGADADRDASGGASADGGADACAGTGGDAGAGTGGGASGRAVLSVAEKLKSARPTAVNLTSAIDHLLRGMTSNNLCAKKMAKRAWELIQQEVKMCDSMARLGAGLIQPNEAVLTHCNTGSLATVGVGTALGVIRHAHRQSKNIHVYITETRPLLQGSRLTAYELKKEGIPYTLICDSMAGALMREGKVQHVLVGADRIAKNGDTANKIGTYSLAVLAHHHRVPFYVTAPFGTVDFSCQTGADIPIENRPVREISYAPEDKQNFNPAFDVTPLALITHFIMDTGIYSKEDFARLKPA